VVVLLEDTLTKGERRLVAQGRDIRVLDYRAEFQAAMREDAIAKIEELTGRKVTAFMSANHIDPDLAAELFVLEPDGEAAPSDDTRFSRRQRRTQQRASTRSWVSSVRGTTPSCCVVAGCRRG
jgi:hypothetical protein